MNQYPAAAGSLFGMARRQTRDGFARQAQREGYAARSAYKLTEIQQRFRVIRKGDRVLDLGCAPGSWLQVAAEIIGAGGVLAGIDLQPVRVSLGPNVRVAQGDAFEHPPQVLLDLAGVERFDVVLSDMAPNTTGDPRSDHFRSIHLTEQALEASGALLRPGGAMVVKVFEGEAYPEFLKAMGCRFTKTKGFRPKATRDVSREIFVIGSGFRGAPEAAEGRPAG